MLRNQHNLSSIDIETRTGTCDRCGEGIKIVKCGKTSSIQYWGCAYAHTQLDRDGNPKIKSAAPTDPSAIRHKTTCRNGHTLTEFDVATATGICERCGKTDIVKSGLSNGVQYWGCAFAYPRKSRTVNKTRHSLTNINSETREATCSQCGLVQIVKSGQGWRCRKAITTSGRPMQLDKYRLHRLSSIDESNRRAICEHCGPVDILKSGVTSKGAIKWVCQHSRKKAGDDIKPVQHRLSNIDPEGLTATCARCGEVSILKKNFLNGKQYWQCQNTIRWQRLHQLYGLTQEDYERMYQVQEGKCAICGAHHEKLLVDHDHQDEAGQVRALLCHNCNTALGHVKDSIRTLLDAVKYLIAHPTPGHAIHSREEAAVYLLSPSSSQ